MSGKADVEAAAVALRAKGCNCVIVTLVKDLAQSQPHPPTELRVLKVLWCLVSREEVFV